MLWTKKNLHILYPIVQTRSGSGSNPLGKPDPDPSIQYGLSTINKDKVLYVQEGLSNPMQSWADSIIPSIIYITYILYPYYDILFVHRSLNIATMSISNLVLN